MKKIFTVLLVAIAVIAMGTSIEASAQKKKSKTRTTQVSNANKRPFEGKYVDENANGKMLPKGFGWTLEFNLYGKTINERETNTGKITQKKCYGYFRYKGDSEEDYYNIIDCKDIDTDNPSVLLENWLSSDWATLHYNPENKTITFEIEPYNEATLKRP